MYKVGGQVYSTYEKKKKDHVHGMDDRWARCKGEGE